MKGLVLMPLALLFGYCGWTCMSRVEKSALTRFLRRHAVPLLLIALVVLSGVWTAVNFASFQVL